MTLAGLRWFSRFLAVRISIIVAILECDRYVKMVP